MFSVLVLIFKNPVFVTPNLFHGQDDSSLNGGKIRMPFLDPKFHEQASRYDLAKLKNIFNELIELDFKIKTGQGEAKMMLEEFLLIC